MTQATQQPLHRALGLTDAEYAQIEETLERPPNDFELAVFSLLWSEHCGYKHSRLELRRLPTNGPRVLQGPGENAGVIDVGGGLAVAFKVESHNHPSAVEPYQGAATGVGGILRDIFAMGARPIALGDSLRLGPLDEERPRELFRGIVRGIGGYGNCVGVPNVVGETVFDPAYRHNPLVNALCIGLLRADELVRASATGQGNLVVLFGATTGRDGIGGASVLASQDLDESDEDKRPSVQVGDPFTGKKLIECTLELAARGLVVSVQDLGAAGLASSTSEMAAGGGVGIELELDRVPLREQAMQPFEIMISESQERMAAIVQPGRLAEVEAVCARWQLPCTVVGHVTDDGRLRCRYEGEVVGDMPADALADAPRYPLHAERPEALAERALTADQLPAITDPAALLLGLLAAPNICAKTWVYEQYDQVVGSGTVARPGGDAGVVRLTPSERGIAVALDGDGARVALDPRRGGAEAVAQAALNVACSGATPAAITNCLNFGNPERPGTAYALREAITGMAEACEVLGTPVVSGNVSLYNESGGRPIHPTPVVGCVGVLERADAAVRAAPAEGGLALFALGTATPAYDGSEWQALVSGSAAGRIPEVDLPALRWLCDVLGELARDGVLASAHDVSDGGLAVALAEIALASGSGVEALIEPGEDAAATLFGECCGLVVVSCSAEEEARLVKACDAAEVPLEKIGALTGSRIALRCGELALDVSLETARSAYEDTLPQAMAAG
ncbi:MAG TPA: phosphoribosylformylglycinamidine synthase subunit PurL [Gaiellales bacterium]|nr:phosphoribosylformylglycinamidine synthase subunit PurL [Gaiellales bacterium]